MIGVPLRYHLISDEEIEESRRYWKEVPKRNELKVILQIIEALVNLNKSMESTDNGISFAKTINRISDKPKYILESLSGDVDKVKKKDSSRFDYLGEAEVSISQMITALADREMTARLLVAFFDQLKAYLLSLSRMNAGLFELLACMLDLTARFCECLTNTDSLEPIKRLLQTNLSIQNRVSMQKWPYGVAVRQFCYENLQPDLWNLFCYICNVPHIAIRINNCVSTRKEFEETCRYLRDYVTKTTETNIIINIANHCEMYELFTQKDDYFPSNLNQILEPQWATPQLTFNNLDDTLYAVSLLYAYSIIEDLESQSDCEEFSRHVIKCATRLMLPSFSVQIATHHFSIYKSNTHNDSNCIENYLKTLCDASASIFRCSRYFVSGLDITLRKQLLRLGCRLWKYGFSRMEVLKNTHIKSSDENTLFETFKNLTILGKIDLTSNYISYLKVGSVLFAESAESVLAYATRECSDESRLRSLYFAIGLFQTAYECLQKRFMISENKSTNEANIFDYLGDSEKFRILIDSEHVKLAQLQCQAVYELYHSQTSNVCPRTANEILKICNRLNRYNSIISRYVEEPFGTLDRFVKDICFFFDYEHDLAKEGNTASVIVTIALICRLIRSELKVELRNHMNGENVRILSDLSSMNDEWWANVPKDITSVCEDIVTNARDLLNQDCEHEKTSEADRLLYYTSIKNACYLFDEMIFNNKCGHLTVHNDDSNSQEISDNEMQTINCLTVMNAKYMNDPNEGRALLGYLFSGGSIFGESEEMFREEVLSDGLDFIRSFTTLYDTLNMWSLYGSSAEGEKSCDGCCIEIDSLTFTEALTNSYDTSFESINSLGAEYINICLPWQGVEDEATLYNVFYLKRIDGGYEVNRSFQNIEADKLQRISTLLKKLNGQVSSLSCMAKDWNSGDELERSKRFVAGQVSPILYIFKDADYYQEEEKRLVIFRDTDEQSLKTIRVLPASEPNAPRRLCINPRYQVYVKSITLGPNVDRADEWVPDLMYRLGKMKAKALKNGIRDYDPKVYFSKIPFR